MKEWNRFFHPVLYKPYVFIASGAQGFNYKRGAAKAKQRDSISGLAVSNALTLIGGNKLYLEYEDV